MAGCDRGDAAAQGCGRGGGWNPGGQHDGQQSFNGRPAQSFLFAAANV